MMRGLYRSRKSALVAGVCAGMARRFQWNVWLVRMAWVLLALITLKIALLAYLILALVLPTTDRSPHSGADEAGVIDGEARRITPANASSLRVQRLEEEFRELERRLKS